MRNHGSWCRILHFRVGDDTDRHAVDALDQAGNVFDLWIVERVAGAVRINPHGTYSRLVACDVGAHGVGGIGNDRIAARRRGKCHMQHVVHRELAAALALGDAPCEKPRGHAMRGRHSVANEQDDVSRLARSCLIDAPLNLPCVRPVGSADGVSSRLWKRNVAQDESGHVRGLLPLDEIGGSTEHTA